MEKNYVFADKIIALREKQGLTQEQLGSKIGVTGKAISKWETGSASPTVDNLRKLSEVFDISLDSLLTIEKGTKNEKRIAKIVLTGGPCAGKSTAMKWINDYFLKTGYMVLFVPETASELIMGNVTPWHFEATTDFQNCLLSLQLEKEKIFEKAALNMPHDKILIVCDRGALDNKAYMSKRDFNLVLKNLGLNEVLLRDQYDAVFHLVTAANGAKEFYNLDNPARTETIEEAVKIDNAIKSAWSGHPHLRIIGNQTGFEEKMKRLIAEIASFLGEPKPYEIERKFLVKMPNMDVLNANPTCKKISIVQTYLKSSDGEELRIRQRGEKDTFTYSKTRKINVDDTTRIEIESRLSQDEYIAELCNADPKKTQIIKDRYCFIHNDQYFELDVFPFDQEHAVLELELRESGQEFELPPFIELIKEVTDNEYFKNVSIAQRQRFMD